MDGWLWDGPGTVLIGSGGVVLAGPDVAADVLTMIERALQGGADGTILLAAVPHTAGDGSPLTVAARTATGWAVRLGAEVQLRADHVGYRSLHAGPCELVLGACTRLALVPPTAPWEASAILHPLPARAGGIGVAVSIAPEVGVPAPRVHGVRCPGCGAWVNLRALLCVACDVVLAPPRHLEVQPAVPVATLVLDDGRAVALRGSVVLGREPQQDPKVRSGEVQSVTLTDSERSVSRVHATLHVDGWDVVVEDHGSANGTWVRPPSAPERVALDPSTPTTVLPGTEIALGRRILRLST